MNSESARSQATTERHPIDSVFLELLKEITSYIPKIQTNEAELTRKWLSKLTGTHPITRNEYARCLLFQLQATGKLDIPFTQMPDMWTELVSLHDALFGPKPGALAPKKAWRAEKVKVAKKLTQQEIELKLAYQNEVMTLQKTRDTLAKRMADECPNFDWIMFRKYNKETEEKQTRLNELKKKNEKLEERNKDLTIFLGELHTFVNQRELKRQEEMATLAEEAKHLAALIDIELDKSLGLLPNEALEQSSLSNE